MNTDTLLHKKLKNRHLKYMDEEGVFSQVEELPTFNHEDPMISFGQYLENNIHHPAFADAINFAGIVEI